MKNFENNNYNLKKIGNESLLINVREKQKTKPLREDILRILIGVQKNKKWGGSQQ